MFSPKSPKCNRVPPPKDLSREHCPDTWLGDHRTTTSRSRFAKSQITTLCKRLWLPRSERRGVPRGCKSRLHRSRAGIIRLICCPCTVRRRIRGRVRRRTTSTPQCLRIQFALRERLAHKAVTQSRQISIRRKRLRASGKASSLPCPSSTTKQSTKRRRAHAAVGIID